jgi:hypothetical protein
VRKVYDYDRFRTLFCGIHWIRRDDTTLTFYLIVFRAEEIFIIEGFNGNLMDLVCEDLPVLPLIVI